MSLCRTYQLYRWRLIQLQIKSTPGQRLQCKSWLLGLSSADRLVATLCHKHFPFLSLFPLCSRSWVSVCQTVQMSTCRCWVCAQSSCNRPPTTTKTPRSSTSSQDESHHGLPAGPTASPRAWGLHSDWVECVQRSILSRPVAVFTSDQSSRGVSLCLPPLWEKHFYKLEHSFQPCYS